MGIKFHSLSWLLEQCFYKHVHNIPTNYRNDPITIKISMSFFTQVEKKSLNFYGTTKTLNGQAILSKKSKARGIIFLG
jgi:hypothetical protein